MWLADALTVSRIPIAAVFWLTYGEPAWSAALVMLAAVTDAVDGRIARASKHRRGIAPDAPTRGDWLDPVADKLFLIGVVGAIVVHDQPSLVLIALIVARELFFLPLALLTALRLIQRPPRHELRAAPIGKVATVAQFLAVAALLILPAAALPLAIIAAVTGVAAVVRYAIAAVGPPGATLPS